MNFVEEVICDNCELKYLAFGKPEVVKSWSKYFVCEDCESLKTNLEDTAEDIGTGR